MFDTTRTYPRNAACILNEVNTFAAISGFVTPDPSNITGNGFWCAGTHLVNHLVAGYECAINGVRKLRARTQVNGFRHSACVNPTKILYKFHIASPFCLGQYYP